MKGRSSAGRSAIAAGLLALLCLAPSPSVSAQASEPLFAAEGWVMTFLLVPVEYWDAPEGPHGHELQEGTIRLYRQGSYRSEMEARAGEGVLLPPGDWLWTAEAEGYASTFTNLLRVPSGSREERTFTVPVMPACRVELSEDRRWSALARLDVVSLDEAAVYPLLPGERRALWVPEGNHLAYGVRGGSISGIGRIRFCRQGEVVLQAFPEPPDADSQSLVVTVGLPETVEAQGRKDLLVELRDPRVRALSPPLYPDAGLFQGGRGAFFFLDVPTEHGHRLEVRHPRLRSRQEPVPVEAGTVREIDLGSLLERRDLEVSIDYRPAREHGSAVVELRYCGTQRSDLPPMLLLPRCGEPLQSHPLVPGFQTYRFPGLDDGQYLVDAVVDDERVPGLGQRVMPYLEPGSTADPVEVARLVEMHVYGRLLVGDESVPGRVRLEPWSEGSGIPSRSFRTDHRDEYHLYYFARFPAEGEVSHFPEELREEAPENLPGLYCCFQLSACGDGNACRTFNIHSAFTGEGRFDLELPGEEVVEVRAVDSTTGEPVPGARLMVRASPAFHFVDGEVLWGAPAGMEPDGLDLGEDGRVRWLPPEPGEHRLYVRAPDYETGSARVEVPAGESVSVTVELERQRFAEGSRLLFDDGEPVSYGHLLAFDDEGRSDVRCHAPVDGEGQAAPPEACADRLFLLVHPLAALQVLPGRDVTVPSTVEVGRRPPFPPRVRLVDGSGEPVRQTFVQLRLGDLILTPDDLMAAASAGVPFRTSNAVGEIVLNGVDPGGAPEVWVSPWAPYEERWVLLAEGWETTELVVELDP